jgi:hypothetical protein
MQQRWRPALRVGKRDSTDRPAGRRMSTLRRFGDVGCISATHSWPNAQHFSTLQHFSCAYTTSLGGKNERSRASGTANWRPCCSPISSTRCCTGLPSWPTPTSSRARPFFSPNKSASITGSNSCSPSPCGGSFSAVCAIGLCRAACCYTCPSRSPMCWRGCVAIISCATCWASLT